ncbi:MAG: M23 family metallopeptidase [Spirochaetota bacterium]
MKQQKYTHSFCQNKGVRFLLGRILFSLLFVCYLPIRTDAKSILLKNLDYKNTKLKRLRKEIFHNLRYSKNSNFRKRNSPYPLRYYRYIVKDKEKFFFIMARTGTNLETLASVNSLSSPHDIYKGMSLLIPNMRGSYYHSKKKVNLKKLAALLRINRASIQLDKKNRKVFVLGKPLSRKEKSFFYGFAFRNPLPNGRISSKYGSRVDPFTKKKTFHGGVDIAAKKGTPVFAAAAGKVILAKRKGGYGKLVIIKHKLGYETRYGHLDKILVKKKQKIKKGQKIGKVGATGRATGPHLHFEVRRFQKRQKPVFAKHL